MSAFELLRFSLSIPTIGDLNIQENREEPDLDRQAFLNEVFSERIDFFYYGRQLTFFPFKDIDLGENRYAGIIGNPVQELVHLGPDDAFALASSKHYKIAYLYFDAAPEKQIAAFEKRNEIGAAHKVLRAMIEEFVRLRKGYSWHVDIEYLSSKQDFWEAAKKYKGQITKLSFEFYPPNGLNGFDKFKEFDRLAKDQANGQSSEYSITNKEGGVDPAGDFVESAVEYASEGPGRITMKSGRKTLYSSRAAKRVVEVVESLMPRNNEHAKILGLFDLLFGRRDD